MLDLLVAAITLPIYLLRVLGRRMLAASLSLDAQARSRVEFLDRDELVVYALTSICFYAFMALCGWGAYSTWFKPAPPPPPPKVMRTVVGKVEDLSYQRRVFVGKRYSVQLTVATPQGRRVYVVEDGRCQGDHKTVEVLASQIEVGKAVKVYTDTAGLGPDGSGFVCADDLSVPTPAPEEGSP